MAGFTDAGRAFYYPTNRSSWHMDSRPATPPGPFWLGGFMGANVRASGSLDASGRLRQCCNGSAGDGPSN
jgi:hypothetical protein